MQIAALTGIVAILIVFAIIESVGRSISESKRYAADKQKDEVKRNEEEKKQRFENFQKMASEQYEMELAQWQSVIYQELSQAKEIQNQRRIIEQLEIDIKNEIIRAEWTKKNNAANDFWQIAINDANILHNKKIDDIYNIRKSYFESNPISVLEYNKLVLSTAYVSTIFPEHSELDYVSDTKTLIVNYNLPKPSDMPTLKEVKFIKSKNAFKESHISQSALNKLYDEVIYQIALATIAELFSADAANALDSVVFNGWVNTMDKSTGHPLTACIISLNTTRIDVESINFKNVDPKECFKKLKGIGSSQLYGIVPIAPIMKINIPLVSEELALSFY
jgi:restriction system protein